VEADVTLRNDSRGAVYAEFLVAFMPIFVGFLSLCQFMELTTANIITKHAAEMTARAAIAVLHDDPKYYGGAGLGSFSGQRKSEIERAAQMMLAPFHGTQNDVRVKMKGSYGRDELVDVKLEFDCPCNVPVGRYVLCSSWKWTYTGGTGGSASGRVTKTLYGQAALPNQGADYTY
jgi:hypothetical protein